MFFVYFIILFVSHMFSNEKLKKEYNDLFLLSATGVLILTLSMALAEFFRIGMFFFIFEIILLPNIFYEIKSVESTKIIRLFFLICCILYAYISFNSLGIIPYEFFF